MSLAAPYLEKINDQGNTVAAFIGRIPHVPVDHDRDVTILRLQPSHQKTVESLGYTWDSLYLAEQVHNSLVNEVIVGETPSVSLASDGLMTADPGVLLGIYVADCGAVYISDTKTRAIALLHSGKKGTEMNIVGKAIEQMAQRYGSRPKDLLVALAPCIRPPVYEIDFGESIQQQALAAGVPKDQFSDSNTCTSSDLDKYYSYRVEKGHTGRMLALLGIR